MKQKACSLQAGISWWDDNRVIGVPADGIGEGGEKTAQEGAVSKKMG